MDKAYFSDIRSQILSLLEKANKEVNIAMAWFTSSELFDSLLSCIERGVKVQLALLDNPINFMEYAPDFNEFIHAGGILKIANPIDGFMHHKFCVIDDASVITGSYNWTYYAENRNLENIIITDSKDVITQYNAEFQRLVDKLQTSNECPKYSWEDLENIQNFDFTDFNFEAKELAKVKRVPIHQAVQTISKVSVTERPLNAVSRFSIALEVADGVEIFIPRLTKLPYTSKTEEFFSTADSVCCCIDKEIADNKFKTIKDAEISKITHGKINQTLRVRFFLHETGDLIATIHCVETRLAIDVKVTDLNLVAYVD